MALEPVHAASRTPDGVAHAHLRSTVRTLVAVGGAIGCGVAAALHWNRYGLGNGLLVAVTYLACGASFGRFNLWLAPPAAAGYLLTLGAVA